MRCPHVHKLPTHSLCQYKLAKVFKHPIVFERLVNNPQQLFGCSNNGLTTAFLGFNAIIKLSQIIAITNRNQRTLHQCRSAQLGSSFRNPSTAFSLVRVRYSGHNAKVSTQLRLISKIIDITNSRQQNSGRAITYPFNADYILIAW